MQLLRGWKCKQITLTFICCSFPLTSCLHMISLAVKRCSRFTYMAMSPGRWFILSVWSCSWRTIATSVINTFHTQCQHAPNETLMTKNLYPSCRNFSICILSGCVWDRMMCVTYCGSTHRYFIESKSASNSVENQLNTDEPAFNFAAESVRHHWMHLKSHADGASCWVQSQYAFQAQFEHAGSLSTLLNFSSLTLH